MSDQPTGLFWQFLLLCQVHRKNPLKGCPQASLCPANLPTLDSTLIIITALVLLMLVVGFYAVAIAARTHFQKKMRA